MKVELGATWRDDHFPCFHVVIDENAFDVWWTSDDVYGRLALVVDGDITLDKALKKYPQMLNVLKNATTLEPYDVEENGSRNWYTDGGCVTLLPKKE